MHIIFVYNLKCTETMNKVLNDSGFRMADNILNNLFTAKFKPESAIYSTANDEIFVKSFYFWSETFFHICNTLILLVTHSSQ